MNCPYLKGALSAIAFKKETKFPARLVLPAFLCSALFSFNVQAADCDWLGGIGNWTDNNWDNCNSPFPNSNDTAAISSGTVTLDQNISVLQFFLSGGTMDGTNNLTISGSSTWTGGDQGGTGITQYDGDLQISGGNNKTLKSSKILNTTGTTTWGGNTGDDNNRINLTGVSPVINNTGTWRDENTFDTRMVQVGAGGIPVFNNTNSYLKLGSSTTTINGFEFNNPGTVSVQAGVLTMRVSGTSTGIYDIQSGTTLQLGSVGANHTLDNITTTGTGKFEIINPGLGNRVFMTGNTSHTGELSIIGNIQVDGQFNAATFNQGDGNLYGDGTVTIAGDATWTDGAMRDNGTTQLNGNLSITGDADKLISENRILNTTGTTTWGGNSGVNTNEIVMLVTNPVINNTGTWRDENAFDTRIRASATAAEFNNMNTYRKLGDTTTTFRAVTLNNTGTFTVEDGKVTTEGNGNDLINEGVLHVAAGAEFEVTGISTDFINNDTITGSGTLIAPPSGLVNNGLVSPGESPGTLFLTGDYTQSSTGDLLIELAGLNAGTDHDVFDISGEASLEGIVTVDLLNNFLPAEGDFFDILFAEMIIGEFSSIVGSPGSGLTWFAQYLVDEVGSRDVVRITAVVPIPAAFWLFCSGLLGLIGISRRKKTD